MHYLNVQLNGHRQHHFLAILGLDSFSCIVYEDSNNNTTHTLIDFILSIQ